MKFLKSFWNGSVTRLTHLYHYYVTGSEAGKTMWDTQVYSGFWDKLSKRCPHPWFYRTRYIWYKRLTFEV